MSETGSACHSTVGVAHFLSHLIPRFAGLVEGECFLVVCRDVGFTALLPFGFRCVRCASASGVSLLVVLVRQMLGDGLVGGHDFVMTSVLEDSSACFRERRLGGVQGSDLR